MYYMSVEYVRIHGRRGSWIVVLLAAVLLVACGGKEQGGKEGADAPEVELTVVMDLDSTTITRFREAGTPAILEFGGHRCVSCEQMKSNFAELREHYPKLRIGYVYWEDSPRLFDAWNIGLIPAQVVLDDEGKEITRHTGVWDVEEMKNVVERLQGSGK